MRADQFLVTHRYAVSRSQAAAWIKAGHVTANDQIICKASQTVAPNAVIRIAPAAQTWVSRSAEKLIAALAHFNLPVMEKTVIDIGASTGGFTQVLIKHGAKKVYAVDVGHGQMADTLRDDPRVVMMEKTNARDITSFTITESVDGIVCDVSFISITLALPPAMALVQPGGWAIALIKPQFEVGKGKVGKGGIVRDQALHSETCDKIDAWFTTKGWRVLGIMPSPITGSDGNQEFLIAAQKP